MSRSSGLHAIQSFTPLPAGTVGFAFTDTAGSTVRWERDRAVMEASVARHEALLTS
jgi:hypothetical protein